MFKRASVGMLALALLLGSTWSTALAQEKTRGKTKGDATKTVEGEVISLDVKKLNIVIKPESGSHETIPLLKDVKVVGPRDGLRKDGLEDEDLDKGAKVRMTLTATGRANQIKILTAAPTAPPVTSKSASTTGKTGATTRTKTADTKGETKTAGATKSTDTKVETKTAGATKSGSTKSGTKTVAKTATDVKGPTGKIVKVDHDTSRFTIVDESGKRTEFTFDADTEFLGPRGGVSEKKSKDDRFVVGAPVQIVLGVSSRTVKEVHLPYRNAIEK